MSNSGFSLASSIVLITCKDDSEHKADYAECEAEMRAALPKF